MSTTEQNLAEAFAGESQANRKYLAFAKQAERDGYPQVARLFRAAAAAETVHAHAHLRAMGGIRSTKENLEEGMDFCLEIAERTPYPDENLASIPDYVVKQRARLQAVFEKLYITAEAT